MPDPAHNPELMRALGRLVRGLSALFWGLPAALLLCFYSARADGLKAFGVVPGLVSTGLLVYGLWLLADFQKQERIWRVALDRALILGLINFGLSPFLYWWSRMPANGFFGTAVVVLILTGLCFLGSLNLVLQRLGAMLPDEALRIEIRQFTSINLNLLFVTFLLTGAWILFRQLRSLPLWLSLLEEILERGSFWLLILLVLLPLAMTMALIWKTKEVILENVFGPRA